MLSVGMLNVTVHFLNVIMLSVVLLNVNSLLPLSDICGQG